MKQPASTASAAGSSESREYGRVVGVRRGCDLLAIYVEREAGGAREIGLNTGSRGFSSLG